MNYCYRKGVLKSVLCWEVVLFSEGPLLEGPLLAIATKENTFLYRG